MGEFPPSSSERLWQVVRDNVEPATVRELAIAAACPLGTADRTVRRWYRGGLLERRAGKPAAWALNAAGRQRDRVPSYAKSGDEVAPRQSVTGPLWRAMRVLSRRGSFDIVGLSVTAGTRPEYARDYLNRLRRAGYVRMSGKHRSATFRLVRDTGLRPPRIDVRAGRRILIDLNTGQRIDISPAAVTLRRKAEPVVDGGVG